MTQEPKPVKREIRFAWHLPKTERREDYHFVRENITYEDGGELPYYESDTFEYRKICDAAKVDLAKLWKIPLLILNYRLLEVTEEEAESVLLRLIERKRNKRSPFKEQGKCAIR